LSTLSIEKLTEMLADCPPDSPDWEELVDEHDFSSADGDIIAFLISHRLGLVALSHKELPDKWLLELARMGYDEALYTLGLRLVTRPGDGRFADLIREFSNHHGLYFQLLEFPGTPIEAKRLLFFCGSRSSDPEIREYVNICANALILSVTDDPDAILAAYDSKEYHALLSISQNPFTPDRILRELTGHCGGKHAKQIRIRSKKTLDFKEK